MKIVRSFKKIPALIPTLILGVAFGIAGIVAYSPVFAAAYMRYDGSSTWNNGVFVCGVEYDGSNINFIDTNTCTFSCDAAHNGQSCTIITETGTVAEPSGCDSSTMCGGGTMYSHVCQASSYTCIDICTPNSACAANTCSTGTCSDSCGNSYAGTKNCSVACSASNSCGMSNSGTLVNGVCNASAPSESLCPPSYAQAAYYAQATYAPSYSQGYYQGSYAPSYSEGYYQSSYYSQSSYAPSCSSPSVTVTASPTRVRSGTTSTLTISGTGISTSCTVSGPGVSQTIPASTCNASRTITTPAITSSSKYTVTCDSGAATSFIIVNTAFGIIEF